MKKTIFVIGAGKGLGNGVAEKFGQEDFKVVLVARNEKSLAEYQKNFAAKNIEVETQSADVTKFDEFVEIFNSLIQKHGTPDVMFYNVGITVPDNKATLNTQTLVEHYIADVVGAYNCLKLIDTKEFAEKSGAILITGGGLALRNAIGSRLAKSRSLKSSSETKARPSFAAALSSLNSSSAFGDLLTSG